MTEGYIKFRCNWQQKEANTPTDLFNELERGRAQLYKRGLIGALPNGIGFGNLSARINDKSFVITGSATGQFARLNSSHYSIVSDYSFAENIVSCIGLTKASAESLAHAAVYEALAWAGSVVHIHCGWLWEKLLGQYPCTSPEMEYGTPDIALNIKSLANKITKDDEKIIVMAGHRDGLIAFGQDIEEATSQIIKIYEYYRTN